MRQQGIQALEELSADKRTSFVQRKISSVYLVEAKENGLTHDRRDCFNPSVSKSRMLGVVIEDILGR